MHHMHRRRCPTGGMVTVVNDRCQWGCYGCSAGWGIREDGVEYPTPEYYALREDDGYEEEEDKAYRDRCEE